MKRKCGFTLIELLAVIVILAVIALIATPLVLNIIERAEKGAFKDSVYGIMEAAEFQVILDDSKYPITYVYPEDSDRIKFKGTKPSEGYIQILSEGKMKLALGNGRWCAVKEVNDSQVSITNGHCEKIDLNRPIISGYGDLNQKINQDETYTMPLVTAVDKDGNKLNITTTIKQGDTIVDKIDTTQIGTYTITYTTDPDSEGNVSAVTITLEVVALPLATDKIIDAGTKGGGLELIDNIYYYRGESPNNWIKFNGVTGDDSLWRIISIENNIMKIIRNVPLAPMAWDTSNNNDWTRPADINTYLNETYKSSLPSTILSKIQSASFYIGMVSSVNGTGGVTSIKTSERGKTWTGDVGLMNVSDYVYATTKENISCINTPIQNTDCKNENWLYRTDYYQWTINATSYNNITINIYPHNGVLGPGCALYYTEGLAKPVIHLKSNVKVVSGDGSESSPYLIQS